MCFVGCHQVSKKKERKEKRKGGGRGWLRLICSSEEEEAKEVTVTTRRAGLQCICFINAVGAHVTQYERAHFLCIQIVILETVQVRTSLSAISYAIRTGELLFTCSRIPLMELFLITSTHISKIACFERQFGVPYVGAPCTSQQAKQ